MYWKVYIPITYFTTCMEIKASASSFLKSSTNSLMIFLIVLSMHSIFLKIAFQEKRINCSLEIWWTFVNLYEILRNSRDDLNAIFSKKNCRTLVVGKDMWILDWVKPNFKRWWPYIDIYVYMFWWTAFKNRIAILFWNVLRPGKEKFWSMHDPSRTVAISLHFPL